jgi:hypothetical protein
VNAPAQRVAEKIAARLLPAVADPVSEWEDFGIGLHCDGCDAPVLPSDAQHEPRLPDGRTLRFQRWC